MEPFSQHEDLAWLAPALAAKDGTGTITAGISTRHNGVSKPPYQSLNMGFHVMDTIEAVQENRQRLGSLIDFPADSWVCAEQVHQNHIERIDRSHKGKGALSYSSAVSKTDGFYTTEPEILLTLNYADCVPLYFYDIRSRAVGIAHAGWRGTVMGIGPKMIQAWKSDLHISSEEVHVLIGPSIGPCCYEVDEKVVREVKAILPKEWQTIAAEKTPGKYDLNLQALNKLLLIKTGVPSENIQTSTACTSCSSHQFFSHRKEQGKTGRIIGFIGMKR